MSWFEEQILERKKQDDELFADSIENIANSITGKRGTIDNTEAENDEIKAILKYYGYSAKAEIPSEITDINERMSYLCRPLGVMHRKVKLTNKWWKDSVGPILAFQKKNHIAIALLPDSFGYHYVENGKKIKITNKNSDFIEAEGYCFYKPFPNKKLNLWDLTKYALTTRSVKDVVLTLVFMGVATLIGLITPKISYFLYGTVVESNSNALLFATFVFLVCVSISSLLFSTFQKMYEGIIETKMNVALSAATMMRILSLPASFFRKYSSGELAERSSYLTSLSKTMVGLLFGSGLSSLFSLAYITSIFKYAPALVACSLIIIAIKVSFTTLVILTRQKIVKETMEISSKESGMTYAMVSGIKKIKIAGAEKRAFARWANLYSGMIQRTYNPPAFIKLSSVITMTITVISTLVIYYFSIKSGIDMAQYTAFNAAYGMLFSAFSSLTSILTTYSNIKPTIEMARPLMEAEPEISENKENVNKLNGKIEFDNVTFAYEEDGPLIVNNMSFQIKPNQYVGIVGKTGCGKSTLIRLLLGFEKPQKGAIYYDGKNLKDLDLRSLRRKIGVVMQDSKLFQGDIFSNITLSAPYLTMDEAWDAAEIAGIAKDIEDMPMGMHTVISEGSGGISGGQRQRLIIARAIAPKPKILIFDEATSALDNITQKKVSEALDSLNCTRIVIAHRLSTIKHCDRILYLDEGKILEDGTYDELIEKKGLFYELVERQRIEE